MLFHHVPAGTITEYKDKIGSGVATHPSADAVWVSPYAAEAPDATMPVYFSRATSTDAINPNDINPEWVYWLLLAAIWLVFGGLFGVLPLLSYRRLGACVSPDAAQLERLPPVT